MKIFKMSDRITLTIKGIIFKLSPLSFAQKGEIHTCTKMNGGVEEQDTIRMTFLAVKYTVKAVSGIIDSNGEKYELEFDGDILSDDCVNDLLNLEICQEVGIAALNFLNGVPRKICDQFQKEIPGVTLSFPQDEVKKKS